jgi:hypothetical protein
MQVLRMDPKKEDWDQWSVDVRDEGFKKRVQDFNPGLAEYFKGLWR